ncbi:MAG: hypothetical protein QOJ57_2677, partial [Thermoleophilaceae bacterium]|nr:hypothetical protein [Thermoleophilaceae bacterium]
QAKAIETVFAAIHAGDADPKLLAYQYLQMLPQIAQGDANKVWIIPSEITQAIGNLGGAVDAVRGAGPPKPPGGPPSQAAPAPARPAMSPPPGTPPGPPEGTA